jgi:hypothetical protein
VIEPYRIEIPTGIRYARVDISSSQTIVTGSVNKWINLLSASIIVANTVSIKWQSSTGPIDISGLQSISPTGGYILPFNAGGWTQTNLGDSLVLFLSASVQVGGMISYVYIGQSGVGPEP